jgi:hypothetical protein
VMLDDHSCHGEVESRMGGKEGESATKEGAVEWTMSGNKDVEKPY